MDGASDSERNQYSQPYTDDSSEDDEGMDTYYEQNNLSSGAMQVTSRSLPNHRQLAVFSVYPIPSSLMQIR